ncbi:MAG: 30S ribosomal protein S1 [Alphaproteobacteria bacterium CG11_big_fil_rev_8_21_14_0_20_44_7]|nr:MAG: 30S ribosomal protein S1 [Alphaproteobacteria bacterium CG11_big_fil_rev_8_21_14_0_20_44_7]
MNASAAKQEQNTPFSTGEDFEKLLEESYTDKKVEEGTIAEGTIVNIENDMVVIDVGLKSEGRLPLKDFASFGEKPDIKEGDKVEVYIERMENRSGEIVISRERALKEQVWDKLEKQLKAEIPVDGIIFGQVKGGFTVDLGGAIAFLPGSQVDVRPIKDITEIANEKDKFLILKMDKKRGNIIVSRRALLEESRAEARDEILKDIELGQKLEGTVKNLTNYGAFIDLGGVDGLLHVTDISWKRISHPSEVLKMGQTINVQVIKYDEDTKRISLGMKQLEDNPWQGMEGKYEVGQRVKGKVSSIADYGVFVALDETVEGLIHVTELSWVKKNQNPNKVVKLGDEIEVQVLEIDQEKRRISLGLKQTQENPWDTFGNTNKVGDVIKGEIKNVSDFGFFVGLDGGIDGLVHYSDLSWDKSGEEALKDYKKGDEVEAKILGIDIEKERVSLGVKQLSGEAPVGVDTSDFKKSEVVTCKVTAIEDGGIEVAVGENEVKAFIKKSELSKDRSEQRPSRFAVGDRVDAKVIGVTQRSGKINVSIKALEVEEHKRAIEEYGSTDSGASLGDILGAALEEKKSKKE